MERVCPRCRILVGDGRRFCAQCGLMVASLPGASLAVRRDAPVGLTIGDYSLSSDLAACALVDKIPLLPAAVEWAIRYWNKPMTRAELLGGGVRVSRSQLPSLFGILDWCAGAMDVPRPELIVKQDPTLNAYTVGTNDDNVVVLHSGLIDALQNDELAFVLAHELGHIKSRHVTLPDDGQVVDRRPRAVPAGVGGSSRSRNRCLVT